VRVISPRGRAYAMSTGQSNSPDRSSERIRCITFPIHTEWLESFPGAAGARHLLERVDGW
jgi:hypothetical protein